MDFVNSEYPPDFVLLYCEQSDPAGGGETVLAPVSAVRELDDDLKEKLRGKYYSDGQLVGLKNVGVDINPFAVLADGERWDFRYTGQLLNAAMAEDVRVAVRALDAALRSRALSVRLAGGEAVVIDQHRIVHGRLALGFDQREIPPEERRLVSRAANTGDNFSFSRDLIRNKGIDISSGIIVSKPYMARRSLAVALKRWPEVTWYTRPPQISLREYPTTDVPLDRMINLMVGDLQRFKVYAEKGFQAPVDVPSMVWDAYGRLVAAGFDQFVIK